MQQLVTTHDTSAFIADSELIQALEIKSTRICLRPDRILFRQGDPPTGIFILKHGTAVLTMNVGARITMQAVTAGGSILGLPGAISGSPYSLTADVLEGSEVAFVSLKELTDLMRAQPSLTLKLLQILASEVTAARQVLCQATTQTYVIPITVAALRALRPSI